jgi:hypothetical protein
MCPRTPIMFASLFDTEIGTDGNTYMAQYVDGTLTWVSSSDNNGGNKKKSQNKQSKWSSCNISYIPIDNDYFNNICDTVSTSRKNRRSSKKY